VSQIEIESDLGLTKLRDFSQDAIAYV